MHENRKLRVSVKKLVVTKWKRKGAKTKVSCKGKKEMEAKAKQTDIKMTARKLRRVINEVRGKAVIEAQNTLRFMPYFAASLFQKNTITFLRTKNLLLST